MSTISGNNSYTFQNGTTVSGSGTASYNGVKGSASGKVSVEGAKGNSYSASGSAVAGPAGVAAEGSVTGPSGQTHSCAIVYSPYAGVAAAGDANAEAAATWARYSG